MRAIASAATPRSISGLFTSCVNSSSARSGFIRAPAPPTARPAQQPGAWWIPAVASAFRWSSSASSRVFRAALDAAACAAGRGREPEQERAAQLVVVPLVRLDHVAVHRGGLAIARVLAELDELPVLDDGDRLAGELPGRDALDRRREAVQVLEERPVALRQRIERFRVEAEAAEPLGDHPVVLGLVADLARQRELHVHVVGGDEPARRDLGGLDLVLERDLQEIEHVQVALDLRLQRVVGRQPAQLPLVLAVELR